MGLASHLGKWQRRKAQGTHASVSPLVKWEDAPPALGSSPVHPSEGGGLRSSPPPTGAPARGVQD